MPSLLLIASFPDSVVDFRGSLVRALQASGVSVHLAVPDAPSGSAVRFELDALGVTVHDIALQRTGTNPIADLGSGFALYRLMRRIQPDAVLAYTIKPVVYGLIAAWLARVPLRFALITGLGYAFQGHVGDRRTLLRALVLRLYAVALSRVRIVFFQNRDDLALFRERRLVGLRTRTLVLDGSGIDLEHYRHVPPANGARFLMIARLLGDKGVREYVAAARRVKSLRPDARFALAGWIDGNPDSIRESELRDWITSGVVEVLGRLDDVRPAIAACSVYVLPSYREGMPRTVLEAMATGRAIITTDAPGCRETVVPGDNGYLVPARCVDALAKAMLVFIDDPTLAPRMGLLSRRMAQDRFDVRRVNAAMLDAMEIKSG